jgi:hypothetical protein
MPKRRCFYREFRNRVPVFRGRTSGKSAVLNLKITVLNRAWRSFGNSATYQEKKTRNCCKKLKVAVKK